MDPQTFKEYFICSLIIAALFFAGAVITIVTARSFAETQPCETPGRGWEPPDLSRCPADTTMWDCIKDAAYRTDI